MKRGGHAHRAPENERAALVEIARVRARPPDGESIESIADEAFPAHRFHLDEELARPWARIWAARSATDGRPRGYVVAWHVADELHILSIATALELRRRGIGSAMMRAIVEYAVHEHIRLILLEVRRSNRPARNLYRR